MIGIEDDGWDNLPDFREDFQRDRRRAESAVTMAAVHLENAIKKTLTGARSGRPYRVSRTGALHIASAPGEPPAVLFGNLRNSVGRSRPEWEGDVAVGILVGPGLGQKPTDGTPDPGRSYARRLEYGGIDSRGVKIDARPYMEPTVEAEAAAIDRILASAFD